MFNKNLIKELFGRNLQSNDIYNYAMHQLKYIISLKNNKITSIEQCPIFFSISPNNRPYLEPYVLTFYHNLGKMHGSLFHKYNKTKNTVFIPYDNSAYINKEYLKNIVTALLKDYSKQNIANFKSIFEYIIDILKNQKFQEKISYNNFSYDNLYSNLLKLVNKPSNINLSSVQNIVYYLFEKEMFNLFVNLLYILLTSNRNNNDAIYKKYHLTYLNLLKMYNNLTKHHDDVNLAYKVTRLKNNNGSYESDFIKFYVPLIDPSIVDGAFYYDSNNKPKIYPKNITQTFLRDVYINGFNKGKNILP